MPVIGGVLHLSGDQTLQERALDFLNQHPRITTGDRNADRLAVVVESDSRAEDKSIWTALEEHPGIVFASVIFADFSDLTAKEIP